VPGGDNGQCYLGLIFEKVEWKKEGKYEKGKRRKDKKNLIEINLVK
jgi:hypothetical protein